MRNNYPLHYSIRRSYVDKFLLKNVAGIAVGSLILDLGGQKYNKRGYFDLEKINSKIVYLNISKSKGTDIQADASTIPIKENCFDAVICCELLEHIQDPIVVLIQIKRVLKKGGKLFLTVPFLYRIHSDPYDYGRYTDQYWKTSLNDLGFNNIIIEKHGLFWSVLVDFLRQYFNYQRIPRPFGRLMRWIIVYMFLNPLQPTILRRENRRDYKSDDFLSSFTTGFGIIAVKG